MDPTFVWLDKAYEEHDSWMFQLRDPVWDPLRTDPRFQEPLRRMKLREKGGRHTEVSVRDTDIV